ncbi:hypothetical protein D3C75_1331880 [compost metagenome]
MANGMFFNSLDLGVAIGTMLLGSVALYNTYAVMYRYSAMAPALLLMLYIAYLTIRRKSNRTSVTSA